MIWNSLQTAISPVSALSYGCEKLNTERSVQYRSDEYDTVKAKHWSTTKMHKLRRLSSVSVYTKSDDILQFCFRIFLTYVEENIE